MNRRDLLKFGIAVSAIPAGVMAQRPEPFWTPAFFNQHQNETIIQFSDVVIPATDTPGAKEALVNRFLDKLLAASDSSFQNQFTSDLGTLDRFSRETAGTDFVRLRGDQQSSVLEKMFLSAQRPSFDNLKAWTARIYYATKPGFDELNKGGVPASFGCS